MSAKPDASLEGRTDEELMEDFDSGERAALEVIFERHKTALTAYSRRITGRQEVAEEVCLEAFSRLCAGAWKPSGSLRAFLFTVVHRLSIDRQRHLGRARRIHGQLAREPRTPQLDPEQRASHTQRARRLDHALSQLHEKYRGPLLLYYKEGLSCQEVAEIVGLDKEQVKARLAYGRRLLKQALDSG